MSEKLFRSNQFAQLKFAWRFIKDDLSIRFEEAKQNIVKTPYIWKKIPNKYLKEVFSFQVLKSNYKKPFLNADLIEIENIWNLCERDPKIEAWPKFPIAFDINIDLVLNTDLWFSTEVKNELQKCFQPPETKDQIIYYLTYFINKENISSEIWEPLIINDQVFEKLVNTLKKHKTIPADAIFNRNDIGTFVNSLFLNLVEPTWFFQIYLHILHILNYPSFPEKDFIENPPSYENTLFNVRYPPTNMNRLLNDNDFSIYYYIPSEVRSLIFQAQLKFILQILKSGIHKQRVFEILNTDERDRLAILTLEDIDINKIKAAKDSVVFNQPFEEQNQLDVNTTINISNVRSVLNNKISNATCVDFVLAPYSRTQWFLSKIGNSTIVTQETNNKNKRAILNLSWSKNFDNLFVLAFSSDHDPYFSSILMTIFGFNFDDKFLFENAPSERILWYLNGLKALLEPFNPADEDKKSEMKADEIFQIMQANTLFEMKMQLLSYLKNCEIPKILLMWLFDQCFVTKNKQRWNTDIIVCFDFKKHSMIDLIQDSPACYIAMLINALFITDLIDNNTFKKWSDCTLQEQKDLLKSFAHYFSFTKVKFYNEQNLFFNCLIGILVFLRIPADDQFFDKSIHDFIRFSIQMSDNEKQNRVRVSYGAELFNCNFSFWSWTPDKHGYL